MKCFVQLCERFEQDKVRANSFHNFIMIMSVEAGSGYEEYKTLTDLWLISTGVMDGVCPGSMY